ncbi:DNA replication/repair protein RecF [Candidatus Aerophobetes bacterium]|nr:DNA replication/repair protein RecF [Candidatus Aerophobetes bacterium]
MWLKNIKVLNFRNFSHLSLDFSPKLNIIRGGNGQGKSNLLEAIYLLGKGESFRTYQDRNLIKWDKNDFYVAGEAERRGSLFKYEVSLSRDSKKRWRVNSRSFPLRDKKWWLWMVVFSVHDLKIVEGGPFCRRNFLDEIACFLYPEYYYLRFSFRKILAERNAFLQRLRKEGKIQSQEAAVWNHQFVEVGTKILLLRMEALKELKKYFTKIYPLISGLRTSVDFSYTCSFADEEKNFFHEEDLSVYRIKKLFTEKLQTLKEKEIERGVSLAGPHRDDFQILINRVEQRTFASQGEKTLVAIALKFAEFELIREKKEEIPILLLDDFPSDLDTERVKYILKLIEEKGQVFIATQHPEMLGENLLSKGSIFTVKGGEITRNDRG